MHKSKTQLIKVLSFKGHAMLSDPEVQKRIEEKVTVNRKYDVPFIAGYSNDGKTIYVDRHFNPMFDKVDVMPYLLIHEKTEKALLDLYHLDYQQAHHLATHNEHMHVKADGLNWKDYTKHFDVYEKNLEHEKLTKVPPDLDLEPYRDEKDENLKRLEQLQQKSAKFSRVDKRV